MEQKAMRYYSRIWMENTNEPTKENKEKLKKILKEKKLMDKERSELIEKSSG